MQKYSCKWCKPPKRHPGCHSTCPEYLSEKEEYDSKMAAYKKKNKTEMDYRSERVEFAIKHRRKGRH